MQRQRIRDDYVLAWCCVAIFALIPFHAFLTTWAGSNFGSLDVWRIWKEILLTVVAIPAIWLAWRTTVLARWLRAAWLPRMIGLYVLLHIGLGVWSYSRGDVNGEALIYGLMANLRYLAFFLLVTVVAFRVGWLRRRVLWTLVVTAGIVIVFGLLQILLLPITFLEHFGYGPSTIPAYQTVDNKISYQRIQSTLRGANPLGAYLVVVLSLGFSRLMGGVSTRLQRGLAGGVLLGLVCLWFTYSRSAILGLGLAVVVVAFLRLPRRYVKQLGLVLLCMALIAPFGVYVLRDNDFVQNTIFHSDEKSTSATSSNFDRLSGLRLGVEEVVRNPLGEGPGTAGPASARNDGPPRIAENYYVQIAQEVGWIGLVLLLSITLLVGRELLRHRYDYLSLGLLAALVGLTLVNMFSHAWTDDSLGLLWWGLAGLVCGSVILKPAKKTKT